MTDLISEDTAITDKLISSMHKLIKKVSEDIEAMKFNTAIAAMMSFVNEVYDIKAISREQLGVFITLLNPFAPHITEEIWEVMGYPNMLNKTSWPVYDPAKCVDDTIEIAVQVNGKLRGRITLPNGATEEEAINASTVNSEIAPQLEGKTIVKKIYVPNKLMNFVVK